MLAGFGRFLHPQSRGKDHKVDTNSRVTSYKQACLLLNGIAEGLLTLV